MIISRSNMNQFPYLCFQGSVISGCVLGASLSLTSSEKHWQSVDQQIRFHIHPPKENTWAGKHFLIMSIDFCFLVTGGRYTISS